MSLGIHEPLALGSLQRPRGAFGIVNAKGDVSEDDLKAHLKDRLVTYKQPRSFEFVDEPVRDDAGKVRRTALRDARIAKLQQQQPA